MATTIVDDPNVFAAASIKLGFLTTAVFKLTLSAPALKTP